jgi:hypothetical protein
MEWKEGGGSDIVPQVRQVPKRGNWKLDSRHPDLTSLASIIRVKDRKLSNPQSIEI